MKKSLFMLLSILSLLSLTACNEIIGNGAVITETKNATGFKKLNIKVPAEIRFTISEAYNVSIKGESNIISDIETTVTNDELVLEFKDKINFRYVPTEPIIIHISAPQLDKVRLSGAANFIALSEIKNGTFVCRASGASKADLLSLLVDKAEFDLSGASMVNIENLNSNSAHIETSGASEVLIHQATIQYLTSSSSGASQVSIKSGTALKQTIDLSGSSSYDGKNLVSRSSDVHASGASDAIVYCEEELTVNASGASDIQYYGHPNTQLHSSGGSEVRHIQGSTPPVDTIPQADSAPPGIEEPDTEPSGASY